MRPRGRRELSANQAIASAQREIGMNGKSVGWPAQQWALVSRPASSSSSNCCAAAPSVEDRSKTAEFARLREDQRRVRQARSACGSGAGFGVISASGQQTSLSAPDVQIAQQLRQIYPDVATALSSVEAAGHRTNQALSGISSSISGPLVTGLADITERDEVGRSRASPT